MPETKWESFDIGQKIAPMTIMTPLGENSMFLINVNSQHVINLSTMTCEETEMAESWQNKFDVRDVQEYGAMKNHQVIFTSYTKLSYYPSLFKFSTN